MLPFEKQFCLRANEGGQEEEMRRRSGRFNSAKGWVEVHNGSRAKEKTNDRRLEKSKQLEEGGDAKKREMLKKVRKQEDEFSVTFS